MAYLVDILRASWEVLVASAPYVLLGILVAGVLKIVLPTGLVGRHLGRGRVLPVLKAALFGVPLPLCSCGVLPAATGLRRQGANRGATSAFLISTPESGVDSIAITWALLDPLMTIARPVAAFAAAAAAGITQNLLWRPGPPDALPADPATPDPADAGQTAPRPRGVLGVAGSALRYALVDVWGDIARWFLLGLLLAGVITALLPADAVQSYLGGGIGTMLAMLAIGIPIYICATSSTPIAAALILKGLSPGAALVFLLAGPATNVTSLTVLARLLGRGGTVVYLAAIALVAVGAGLTVDQLYAALGLAPTALAGTHAELLPEWIGIVCAVILLAISLPPLLRPLEARLSRRGRRAPGAANDGCGCDAAEAPSCGCAGPSGST